MNNEFYQHKKSDTIKWVITFVSIILLTAAVIGLRAYIAGVVDTKSSDVTDVGNEEAAVEKDDLTTVEIVNSERMLLSTTKYMREATSPGAKASSGYKVTATVLPEGADQNLIWTCSFVDPDNYWVNDLQVDAEDFVVIESENAENTVVYISAYSPFGAQIKVTATSVKNPDVSAYILVDYMQRLDSEQLLDTIAGGFFVGEPSSDGINLVTGIVYDTADNMASMYYTPVEMARLTLQWGTLEPDFLEARYSLNISSEFIEALNAQGLALETLDSYYFGIDEIPAALIINTIAGEEIIPDLDAAIVNKDKINAFNRAAASMGNKVAFTLEIEVSTFIETETFFFDFAFESNSVVIYPAAIEFDKTNIVL